MSDRLFVSSVNVADGRVLLGFSVGTPVALSGSTRRRDLPGGLAEYAMTVSSGDDRFELRAVADAGGFVSRVIAGAGDIPDDWCA